MSFTFTGPEQLAAQTQVNAGAFYWQRPNVFLNGSTPTSERIALVTDTRSATNRLRAYLRDNNAGTWTELDAGNGPATSKSSLGGLQSPAACPTFIDDPTDTTKIICAYPRALDASLSFVLFDKVAKTFGVPVTGGPVVHGVDQVFSGSVSNDDTGAKTCVTYRSTDNKLLFIYQGPTEVVNAHTCLRPYYVTYDRTGASWGAGTVLAGAGEDNPFIVHGVVIDPDTEKAYATIIRPPNGKASPNNVTYNLYMVEIDTADVFGAKVLMTDTVKQAREPLISYPVLRSVSGSFELMCGFIKNQLQVDLAAAAVRGMVGSSPVFTVEEASTGVADQPGDGSNVATVGIGVDSANVPYLFWFHNNETVDFFYKLFYSSGGDAGSAWITPVLLYTTEEDDSTDFMDNGPAVSVLDGLGSIGFGIVGFSTFLSTSVGATLVDGVAYFEFIPEFVPPPAAAPPVKATVGGGTYFPRFLNRNLVDLQLSHHYPPMSWMLDFPNAFDICLSREWRLYNAIDPKALACCHKPECFNESGVKPWVDAPYGAATFNPNKAIPLPDPATIDAVVLSFRVPLGYDGIVLGQYQCYRGGGTFVEGSGDIVWRVRVNGRYLRDMGNMQFTLGSPQRLSPCPGGLWLMSGNLVEYVVSAPNTSGSLPLPGQGNILASLHGWFFPRGH